MIQFVNVYLYSLTARQVPQLLIDTNRIDNIIAKFILNDYYFCSPNNGIIEP